MILSRQTLYQSLQSTMTENAVIEISNSTSTTSYPILANPILDSVITKKI
jgi:hypothetical protein